MREVGVGTHSVLTKSEGEARRFSCVDNDFGVTGMSLTSKN
jgi:hypothetical protein